VKTSKVTENNEQLETEPSNNISSDIDFNTSNSSNEGTRYYFLIILTFN
jgi:hypothetical protein